jgi:hypothetical protein
MESQEIELSSEAGTAKRLKRNEGLQGHKEFSKSH